MTECRVCRITILMGTQEGYVDITMKELRKEAMMMKICPMPRKKAELLKDILEAYRCQYTEDYSIAGLTYYACEELFEPVHAISLKFRVVKSAFQNVC